MRVIVLALSIGFGFGLIASPAAGQMEELSPFDFEDEPSTGDEQAGSDPAMLEEFEIDTRDAVLSAARTKTNIQEAPGIITVITAAEIRARGHRTVNDVLRTVPGFEGDRLESNGWFVESIARGQPRTLLVLLNGVNITEPVRNTLSMDRKIPIESVKRIEVTSGPGGVLWGSNALLGVVNIILKDASDLSGLEFAVGGGHGAGALEAASGRIAYGGKLFGGDLSLYTAVDFYSDRGAELEVDVRKVLGVLPQPELDGKTIYDPRGGVTDWNSREWYGAHTLVLRLFDTLTLDWQLQFEDTYRQIATGGALLQGSELIDPATGAERTVEVETRGIDPVQMVAIGWRDRFLRDKLGFSARLYGVRFQVEEDPFWAFPPRYVPGVSALADGVSIGLTVGQELRYGLNLDADLDLGSHKIVMGFEGLQERVVDAYRSDTLRKRVHLPRLGGRDPATGLIPDAAIFGPDRCPTPGRRQVAVGVELIDVLFFENCRFEERFIEDSQRTVGAFYLSDEWRLARSLSIQPGFRVQLSDAYDPVVLFAGALVWNVVDRVFLKLNYTEGFRPPSYDSTNIVDTAVSTLSYQSGEDIQVETSRAGEVELNAVILEGVGPLRRIYLRGDYAYTVLSDVIRNVGGAFGNSGQRAIHSVEGFGRMEFSAGHELWAGGHFLVTEDSVAGPVRNFANTAFSGGARFRIVGPLELSGQATYIGPQEDLNRPIGDRAFPPGTNSGFYETDPTDIVVERIEPTVTLRVGVRLLELWDERLELSAFVYNALDVRRADPDFFFDDRVLSRPQPREGWSAFGQIKARVF